jgi:hypothetical protein
LHKIKSFKLIRGVIERNHNLKDYNELYHNNIVLITVYLLKFFYEKTA